MEINHIPANPSGSWKCSSGTPGAAHGHARAQEPNSTSPGLTAGPGLMCRTERAPCAKAKLPQVILTQPARPHPSQLSHPGTMVPHCDSGQAQCFPTEQSCKEPQILWDPGLFPVERRGRRGPWVCQWGGCRREAPVHTVRCPLSPWSHRPLWLPQPARQRIMEFMGWERTFISTVQSNPYREQGHLQLGC